MKVTRTYTQRARAESAAATRQRIIESTVTALGQSPNVTLAGVATIAGVSVQTVLRHFDNRDALITQAVTMLADERATPPGDPTHAIRVLYDQYEHRGDANIGLLSKEHADPHVKGLMDRGRAAHRTWVEQAFASAVSGHDPAAHGVLLDLLTVATDVYTWKLLRRDRGLSRRLAESCVRELIERILR